jgi:hypothetical protein
VEYRRAAWSAATGTKQRTFRRRADLDRFIAGRLYGAPRPGRPELSPLSLVRVTWRHVGTWQTGAP